MNHKTAPIALREKLVFSSENTSLYLNDFLNQSVHHEAVMLSTCNRTELYCVTEDVNITKDWFYQQYTGHPKELRSHLYFYQDQDAIAHIMRVACGLDSMVLGESQIAGQMKDAFSESCAAGGVGSILNRLFQHVFAITKEIRNATSLGACPVSISSAAVHFIKSTYPDDFQKANILLIGAGSTMELVLRYLQPDLVSSITIANRSEEKAEQLASQYSAKKIKWTQLSSAIAKTDILITSTSSPVPIVTSDMLTNRSKPIYIMDIAVPRDVDVSSAQLEQVHLYSIDDLKTIIHQNRRGLEHAAHKAQDMVTIKSQEFMKWLNALDEVTSTIRTYRRQIENVSQLELSKSLRQLERGEDPIQVLTRFSYILTNKILHAPSVQLRQAGVEGRFEIVQLVQQLLKISLPENELS